MLAFNSLVAQSQHLNLEKLKAIEHQLEDVMEMTDTSEIKRKINETESAYQQHPDHLNQLRLGIVYHETALNLSFFEKTTYTGYAKKSFDILSGLYEHSQVPAEMLPFIAAYRASALSLVSAETKKLGDLNKAFLLFDEAVKQYAAISYLPEFLRGSVAENLPWFLFSKRKYAKTDFQSIIEKQERQEDYAGAKIMSFTYWAWANQRKGKKHRTQAINYLDKAIALDPEYKAGRKKAEALKNTFAAKNNNTIS
jgi:hypothetical protein